MKTDNWIRQAADALGSGDLSAAERLLTRVLKKQPGNLDAMNLAGVLAYYQGNNRRAIEMLHRVVKRQPDHGGAHLNLGAALNAQAQHAAAEFHYRSALKLDPENHIALTNLGKNYLDQNKLDQARDCLERAVERNGRYWIARHNLGTCLQRLGDYAGAQQQFEQALTSGAGKDSISELIETLRRTEQFDTEYQLASELAATTNAGDAIISAWETFFDAFDWGGVGRLQPRVLELLTARETRPECRRAALMMLNSLADISPATLLSAHGAWAEQVASQHGEKPLLIPAKSRPQRLRVGYLSADFRSHSVGFFIRKLIGAHDKRRFEIYCYSNSTTDDAVTREIREGADVFCPIAQLSDAELVRRIRADGIHILVDLSGHTRGTRIGLLSHRLAAVQVTYLGYPNTTGLSTVDYRLTDPYADCHNGTQYSEELAQLPASFLCFGSFEDVVAAAATPYEASEHVTFGCYNNIRKLTPDTVRVWCEILKRVPSARLIIKSRRAAHPITRKNLHTAFSEHGVDPERVLTPSVHAGRRDHLESYNEIDIALDTFPYNGTTTTCEALWMGVPVVTLAGKLHAQRVSWSILNNIGYPDLATWSEADYVDKSVELAQDAARLSSMRCQIRQALRDSILCQPDRFTSQLEQLYDDLWTEKSGKDSPLALAATALDPG